MKFLITGAAGFIGSQLAHRLWKNGHSLVLIDNFSYGKEDNLIFDDCDFRKTVIKMDIRDKKGVEQLLKNGDVDFIYNIAGIAPLPDCQIDPQEAISVNVGGFANILELSRLYGVKAVIQASTNAIYENETVFPTPENFSALPTLIYPNTKYCAERIAESFCKTYDMNVACVRFANVYGPHVDCLRKQPPFVAYMVRELRAGRTPIFHSDGTQRRDYVYVEDLVNLLIAVQKVKGFDTVNCSSQVNYSVNEMYEMAQDIMGKHISPQYASDSHYWEKYPQLYNGFYTIKPEILKHEIEKYSLCNNSHAKEVYGWEPTVSMLEGLEKLINSICKMLDKYEERNGNE